MSSLQVALFAFLVLLVAYPFSAIVWKGTNLRRRLWRLGCWRWVICCDRFYSEGVNRVDMMERGGGATTVQAHYELMLGAPREPQSSLPLRLAAWRDDVRRHATRERVLTAKLEMIQIQNEAMQRVEPLVLPVLMKSDDANEGETKAKTQGTQRQEKLQPLQEPLNERIQQEAKCQEQVRSVKEEEGEEKTQELEESSTKV